MHIRKTLRVWGREVYGYDVFYRGYRVSGPDLGACIAACHGAATN